jgi:hypothetical protein
MNPTIRPASHDEPAVTSPELEHLVALARDQRVPPLRVDADAVFTGFTAAKRRQRRIGAIVGGLLAAGLAALALTRLDLDASRDAAMSGQVAEFTASPLEAARPIRSVGPTLAAPIRIVAEGETPSPTVFGPWDVGLAPGTYHVDVEDHPGDEFLRARSAGGEVEVRNGRVHIVVGADHTEARLEYGVATWIAPLGERRPLSVDVGPVSAGNAGAADASELARRAEGHLTAGERDDAIRLLIQLVTDHAEHPVARSGLIDLAGLFRGVGRVDEARCAYRLYLRRYSGKAQLADEVEKALRRLGDGPTCDGLRPR